MAPDEKNDGMPDFSGVTGGASTTAKDAQGKPVEADVNEIYEVVSGDSLSKIAKHKYGNAGLWHRNYEANRDFIKNPDGIQVGWKLKIPAKPAE
jgi:nucleoid-associated protein YgaU